jgi:hypothetical protein
MYWRKDGKRFRQSIGVMPRIEAEQVFYAALTAAGVEFDRVLRDSAQREAEFEDLLVEVLREFRLPHERQYRLQENAGTADLFIFRTAICEVKNELGPAAFFRAMGQVLGYRLAAGRKLGAWVICRAVSRDVDVLEREYAREHGVELIVGIREFRERIALVSRHPLSELQT